MSLYYREMGSGQPVIILHGLFGNSDNWVSPAKLLEDHYHVYLLDQRNHGRSDHSDLFTYDIMAEDLSSFIDEHNIVNPHIIGHSMGGKVAMKFASKYPYKFNKLVVVDIAPKYYPVHHQVILEALNSIDLSSLDSRGQAESQLSSHIPELAVRQFLLKNLYRDDEGKFQWRINLSVLTEKIENIGEALAEDARIEAETLFVKGNNSGYIKTGDEVLINKLFSNAKILGIEGAGHWVHAEKPAEFVKIIKDFLKD